MFICKKLKKWTKAPSEGRPKVFILIIGCCGVNIEQITATETILIGYFIESGYGVERGIFFLFCVCVKYLKKYFI